MIQITWVICIHTYIEVLNSARSGTDTNSRREKDPSFLLFLRRDAFHEVQPPAEFRLGWEDMPLWIQIE